MHAEDSFSGRGKRCRVIYVTSDVLRLFSSSDLPKGRERNLASAVFNLLSPDLGGRETEAINGGSQLLDDCRFISDLFPLLQNRAEAFVVGFKKG